MYFHNEHVFQSCSMFTPFPPCPMRLVFLSAYSLSQFSAASISWPSARKKKRFSHYSQGNKGQPWAAHAMSGSYLSQHAMKGHLRQRRIWRPWKDTYVHKRQPAIEDLMSLQPSSEQYAASVGQTAKDWAPICGVTMVFLAMRGA